MRVELLASVDCPHVERAEEAVRSAIVELDGVDPHINRVFVSDIDNAAGLGFHGSPTVRIDGRDVVPVPSDLPITLGCRLYTQPNGTLDGVVPVESIVAEMERRREAEAQANAAKTQIGDVPGKVSRATFLWASRRRSLAAFATAFPLTRAMVRRFVAGDKLEHAIGALDGLAERGMTWTVDVLGESVDSRAAAMASADSYIKTLDALAERGLEANVSLKLTQMGLDIDRDFCVENVSRVIARAAEVGAFVRCDMEDHTRTQVTLDIVRELRRIHPDVGAVIQSYLYRSAADIDALNHERIRVRLCKGAYDEPATVAYPGKDEVDESYRVLMERLLLEGNYPALATHDEKLLQHAIKFALENGIGPERFEFQMLYGVRRDLHDWLAGLGWTVRVYVPYGTQWYPYYMRRMAERPANIVFIMASVLREGRGSTGSTNPSN